MKRLQTRAAAAALSALLLALPTCALAAETAPLTLSAGRTPDGFGAAERLWPQPYVHGRFRFG